MICTAVIGYEKKMKLTPRSAATHICIRIAYDVTFFLNGSITMCL